MYLLNNVLQTFGHHLDGQGKLPYLTAAHLRAEATTWGLTEAVVCETIASVGSSVRQALSDCPADGIDIDRIGALIDARATAALQVVS